MERTPAIAILKQAQLDFEIGEFEAVDFTAEEVASKLNIPLETVYKTLVVVGETTGPAMAVVQGDKELNLKKMANALCDKRASLIKLNDLQKITGYLKGGCSPLGSKRNLPVFIDRQALNHSRISVSAGLRGLQLLIAPDVLIEASRATVSDLSS